MCDYASEKNTIISVRYTKYGKKVKSVIPGIKHYVIREE
jgi:hypothetical protein